MGNPFKDRIALPQNSSIDDLSITFFDVNSTFIGKYYVNFGEEWFGGPIEDAIGVEQVLRPSAVTRTTKTLYLAVSGKPYIAYNYNNSSYNINVDTPCVASTPMPTSSPVPDEDYDFCK